MFEMAGRTIHARTRRGFGMTNVPSLNPTDAGPTSPATRTALLMPVCHEAVPALRATLVAMRAGLQRRGVAEDFEVVLDQHVVLQDCDGGGAFE